MANCSRETTMLPAICTARGGSHRCEVMRKRRHSHSSRGVSAAQTYHSVAATRNSWRKLSGRLRETANTYACPAKVRTIRVQAPKIASQVRTRRERDEIAFVCTL